MIKHWKRMPYSQMWYFTPVVPALEKVETGGLGGQDQLHTESDASLGYIGPFFQRRVVWRDISIVRTMYCFSRGLGLQRILTRFPVSTRSILSPHIG